MSDEAANAVRQLIGAASDSRNTKEIANHAVAACQLLSQHLSRLVGELGVRTLFARCLSLASPTFPCVGAPPPTETDDPYDVLRRCLEQQPPESATEAAIHVLQTYIALLERFIGVGLVASLLHEVWPATFPATDIKETT